MIRKLGATIALVAGMFGFYIVTPASAAPAVPVATSVASHDLTAQITVTGWCPRTTRLPSTISQGSVGGCVKYAQFLLNSWMGVPDIAMDGKFGPQTAARTKAFQARYGLSRDGIIGPRTWSMLLR